MTDLYTNALEPKVLKLYHELPRLLTHWRLRPLVRQYPDFEDAVGEATLGVLKAASQFDANRGVSFPTYAYWKIRSALQRGLARNGSRSVIGIHRDQYTRTGGTDGHPRTIPAIWDKPDGEDIVSKELSVYDRGPQIVDARDEWKWLTQDVASERNLGMLMDRINGERLTIIGQRYRLSKERTRQIQNETAAIIRERAAEVRMGVTV